MSSKGGFYIAQIKQLQERIFSKLLNEYGLNINGTQGRILYILWQEDTLTMSEISRKTSLANNTLTSVIDHMVYKGLVQREQNPQNRRQTVVTLTEKAKMAQKSYDQVSVEMTKLFYTGFTGDEIQQCEGYLARLLENLKKVDNCN